VIKPTDQQPGLILNEKKRRHLVLVPLAQSATAAEIAQAHENALDTLTRWCSTAMLSTVADEN